MVSAAFPFASFRNAHPQPGQQSGISMSKSTCSSTKPYGFEPAKLREFLRRLFPRDTAKAAGAALDLSHRTVENWLGGKSRPDFDACGKMIELWGVEFLVAVMTTPPAWAVDALARAELADLERRSAALHTKLREAREGST
jgi:hypothetical protein